MYTCLKPSSIYVCMPQTYIQKSNIHTQLVDLPYRKAFQEALERVCMFENPLPVMENETYIHDQISMKSVKSCTQEALTHVCMFENPLPVMENCFKLYGVLRMRWRLSILMRRANSEYVCMYVCLTNPSKNVCMPEAF